MRGKTSRRTLIGVFVRALWSVVAMGLTLWGGAQRLRAGGSFPDGPAEILLASPVENATYVGTLPVQFSTTTTPVDSFLSFVSFTSPISSSAKLVFPGATGPVSDSFVVDLTQPLDSNPAFEEAFPPRETLPDGLYDVSMDYFDTEGRLPYFLAQNVRLDSGITQPVGLLAAFSNSSLQLDIGFAEQPTMNESAQLVLQHMPSGTVTQLGLATQTLPSAPPFSGNGHPFQLAFVWDGTSDPTLSTSSVVSWNGNPLISGPYIAQLSYQDVLLHAPATNTTTFEFVSSGGPPDTQTQPPVLTSPAPGGECNRFCLFEYLIPESPMPGSMYFYFNRLDAPASTQFHVTEPSVNTSEFVMFDFSLPLDVQPPVISVTGANPVQDGVYSVSLTYRDQAGNPPASAVSTPVRIDSGVTQPPVLSLPVDGSTHPVTVPIQFTLPEQASSNFSAQLNLFSPSQNLTTIINLDPFQLPPTSPLSFVWNGIDDPSVNASFVSGWNGVPLSVGDYFVFLEYRDFFDNPPANASSNIFFGVVEDTETLPPTIVSPANGGVANGVFDLEYTLPEAPKPGSMFLTWFGSGPPVTSTQAELTVPGSSGTHSLSLNLQGSLNGQPGLAGVIGSDPIPDGVYSVTLYYQDQASNPPGSDTAVSVRIDSGLTRPPLLNQPVDGSTHPDLIPFEIGVLEQASSNFATRLSLTNPVENLTTVLTLDPAQLIPNTPVSFVWNGLGDPTVNASFVSGWNGVPLVTGPYEVLFEYRDFLGNPPSNRSSNIFFGSIADTVTEPPVIQFPNPGSVHIGQFEWQFVLPEVPQPGSVLFHFAHANSSLSTLLSPVSVPVFNTTISYDVGVGIPLINHPGLQFVSGSSVLLDDDYTFSVSYRDSTGNPPAITSIPGLRLDRGIAQSPLWTAPVPENRFSFTVPITYSLLEAASFNTVRFSFTDLETLTPRTFFMTEERNVDTLLHVASDNFSLPATVRSFTGPPFVPGRYRVSFDYEDAVGNPLFNFTVREVLIDLGDSVTNAPVLYSPSVVIPSNFQVSIHYQLTERAASNSVRLSFVNTQTSTSTSLRLTNTEPGQHSFVWTQPNPAENLIEVASQNGPSLAEGRYVVTLSYQDQFMNPEASTSNIDVVIDPITTPPQLLFPTPGTESFGKINVLWDLLEAAAPSTATLTLTSLMNASSSIDVFLNEPLSNSSLRSFTLRSSSSASLIPQVNAIQFPPGGLVDGPYNLRLRYQDALLNPPAEVTVAPVVLFWSEADIDDDGILDSFELEKFMSLAVLGTGDRDGDGVPDAAEVIAGTDPDDPTSRLIVDPPVRESDNSVCVTVPTVPGRIYQFQVNDGLSESGWMNVGQAILATGNQLKFFDLTSSLILRRFYRVIVVDAVNP